MAYKPIGARVLVQDIITEIDLVARGAKLGLQIITDERNTPKPTVGRVVEIGTDPMLREVGIRKGAIVQFGKLAGTWVYLEGVQFRSLELDEIIGVDDSTTEPEPKREPVLQRPVQ